LATCVTLLDKAYSDPRYRDFPREELDWISRVTVIAKDLLRFLESAYRMGYSDVGRLSGILNGFARLVRKYTGWKPTPGTAFFHLRPLWPADPMDYEFGDISPVDTLLLYFAPDIVEVKVEENMADVSLQYDEAGMAFTGNSTKRLKLLEMLGYVKREVVTRQATGYDQMKILGSQRWFDEDDEKQSYVYQYEIIRDIPYQFMYSD
jgi:hypothetical protein